MKKTLTLLASALLCASCATSPPAAKRPPAGLTIMSRAEWVAHPPVAPMKPHTPNRITIHHTATLQKFDRPLKDKLKALQNFSQNEGKLGNGKPKPAWPDVPYHFYIDCHGEIAEGRDVNFTGDTNTEYDPTGHALVVLEGNFEEEQPTAAQLAALKKMIAWLAARYDVPSDRIKSHKDYAQTACPGKNLYDRLPDLRRSAL